MKELFLAARERRPEQRASYLAEACGDNPELRREVESLLIEHDRQHSAGTAAAPPDPHPASSDSADELVIGPLVGRTLGRYRILGVVGKGGMGTVYEAEDPELRRTVALKILPPAVAGDPKRLERFKREARSVAALSHPNVVTLHSVEEEGEIHFLTMELVHGEPLDRLIPDHGLDLGEILDRATQLAEGLRAAHEQGIIHRDLKPANLIVDTEGRLRILDFGLAKAQPDRPDGSQAGTSLELTVRGTVLGTAPYMSPEQVEGKPLDARSDIFSFGSILYEMATGRWPFPGETLGAVTAAILRDEPTPLTRLRKDLPEGVQWIVDRCLAKEPAKRYQSARELRDALAEMQAARAAPAPAMAAVPIATQQAVAEPNVHSARRGWLVVAAVVLGLGLAAAGWLAGRLTVTEPAESLAPVERHLVDATGAEELGELSNPVLSPDGTKMAFVASTDAGLQLYLRRFDELEARPVAGSDNAGWATFSPDGEWLLFFDVVDRRLKKVSIHGGRASEVVVPSYLPASWERDGYIYYTPATVGSRGTPDSKGLWRIAAERGEPEQLSRADPRPGTPRHLGHYAPRLLPGGRKLLFSVGDGYLHSDWDVAVLDLDTGKWQRVFEGARQPTLVAEHLVFWRDNRLWAAPFDLERLQTLAAPRPVLEGISRHPLAPVEVGQYRVSAGGDLVYLGGATATEELAGLVAAPFGGGEVPLHSMLNERVHSPRLSPDRRLVAFERCVTPDTEGQNDECQIWAVELGDGSLDPLTEAGVQAVSPLLEAAGEALIYTELAPGGGAWRLMRQPLDGSAATALVEALDAVQMLSAVSHRDGRLVFNFGRIPDAEIRLRSPDGSVDVLVEAGSRQQATDLSPDGRWLVFHSDRSGQFELYALDLDAERARPRQLTTDGSMFGQFAPDGQSLFMRSRSYPGPAEILRAPFDPATGQLGKSDSVMATPAQGFTSAWWWLGLFEVTDDGLIMAQLRTPPRSGRIVLVRNWARELSDRMAR